MGGASGGADDFEVRWIKKRGGGNLPLLFHGQPYIPVRLPFHYMTLATEDRYAESSQGAIAGVLKALYQYCYRVAQIDLESILVNGQPLSTDDIVGFARWLRNGRQDPNNLVGKIGLASDDNQIILRSTVGDYLKHTKQYLIWAADTFISTGPESDVSKRFIEAKARINRIFERFKRPNKQDLAKGLDANQMHQLRLVARPGSSLNPFKGKDVQFRNWCILEILYSTGIRRGELLAAYSSDKPTRHNDNKWEVVRRPPDPRDPRNPRPAVKTIARSIKLLPRHSDLLKEYVDKYRFVITSDASGAQKKRKPAHDFLFISTEDGAPLSLDAVNKMLTTLGDVAFPDGEVIIHPHLLRNTFCNEFMAHTIDEEGVSLDMAMEELRRLCGWSLRSEMPLLYARKWKEAAADDAQERMLLAREKE